MCNWIGFDFVKSMAAGIEVKCPHFDCADLRLKLLI